MSSARGGSGRIQGVAGRYGARRAEGSLPEDLLSPIGFGWLWGILDRAVVIEWKEPITLRMRAAGRVAA